jgi:putative NIF3 family GTP cyclohydrolase 1 type 2
MSVDTAEIMKIGLDLVNWDKLPSDSAIHLKGNNIRKILITVDVSIAELIFANKINCDAVVAHHPIGASYLKFHQVLSRHVDYMIQNGIAKDAAKRVVKELKRRVEIRSHASIYKQIVDTAKILEMPLVNIHQPCDEYMRRVIQKKIRNCKSNHKVSHLLNLIREIPEFRNALNQPLVVLGSANNNVGRVALVVAAGTNGGFPVAKLYYQNNISTVIYLHIDPTDAAKLNAEKIEGNLVILGHLAGDSIGLNALAAGLEEKGVETIKIGIVPASKRNRG